MKIIGKQTKNNIFFIAGSVILVLTLVFNDSVKQGVSRGISLCLDSVVPSLFPLLIISSFLTGLGLPKRMRRLLFLPVRLVTGINENAAESFIFGSLAGYPAGVKTARRLYDENRLGIRDAKKAALINVSPGIAFSVLVSGKIFFGSAVTGLTLFFSVTLANLMTGILLRTKKQRSRHGPQYTEKGADVSLCLINAVASSVKSSVSVCAWIIAFSAFSAPLTRIPDLPYIQVLLEVTAGTAFCAEKGYLPLCAFTMGFGGLCVFFQLLPDLKALGISALKYLLCRMFSGTAAFFIENVIIMIFPMEKTVFSAGESLFRISSPSLHGSVALIFLCAVFMLSVYGDKNLYA